MTSPGPVAFTVFGIDVMWYGILVASAFCLAIMLCYFRAPKHQIQPDHVLDFAIWMIPFAIIGARLYYVLFNWKDYAGDIHAILAIRSGGLAIHGGLFAGIIVGILVCRHYKINLVEMMDLVFPAVALGQAIGRWGNFFNSEAYGVPADLPWSIIVNDLKVHPTFLYESIWCFLLFLFLIWVDRKRKFRGQIVLLYAILYSAERAVVEGLRTDSLYFLGIRQAQIVSVAVFIVCTSIYIYNIRKLRADQEKQDLADAEEQAKIIAAEMDAEDAAYDAIIAAAGK